MASVFSCAAARGVIYMYVCMYVYIYVYIYIFLSILISMHAFKICQKRICEHQDFVRKHHGKNVNSSGHPIGLYMNEMFFLDIDLVQ